MPEKTIQVNQAMSGDPTRPDGDREGRSAVEGDARWQIGVDARQREDPLRDIQRLVHPTLPGTCPDSTTP